MEILNFLQSRRSMSAKHLGQPVPNEEQLAEIFQAAVTAPDHGSLRPWRFIVIEGEARKKLGDAFAEATRRREPDASEEAIENARSKPLRSPMIIAVCAIIRQDNPKVPVVEQVVSAGIAAHNIIMGLNAMNFGSILLTGANAYDPMVKQELGLEEKDSIVGFVYTGTPTSRIPVKSRPQYYNFVDHYTPKS
jgi:nitroreductase